MLSLRKIVNFRTFQVHCKCLYQTLDKSIIQNVRMRKSFAFEANMRLVLDNIRQILACNEDKAHNIYDEFPSIRSMERMTKAKKNIELLMQYGSSMECITENPFLLVIDEDILQRKLDLISSIYSKRIDDLVPLIEMKEERLKYVCNMLDRESSQIPDENRIYYLSKKLNIEASVVAKFCAKNEYILTVAFDKVDKKLNILLDYNINPMSILRCLYALDRADVVYVSRLERLLSAGSKDIKMWFLKCADDIFENYLRSLPKSSHSLQFKIVKPYIDEKLKIENELNEMLDCENEEAAAIYYKQISRFDQMDDAKRNIEFLQENGVSLKAITNNSMVLVVPIDKLRKKMEILFDMNPKYIDDIFPLVTIDDLMLEKFKEFVQDISDVHQHPIYYFSKELQIEPYIVSTYFAKSPEQFLVDPSKLIEKLNLLIHYDVELESILKSPATFKLNYKTIEKKLKELKSQNVEEITSPMLAYRSVQLKKITNQLVEEKQLLDGCTDVVEYASKRLGWDKQTKQNALKSNPLFTKCKISKVEKHFNFLLNETTFTKDDINSCMRVFSCNLDELKLRWKELSTIDLVPRKLYLFCSDRKSYLKMIERHCQLQNDDKIWINFRSIEKRLKEKKLNKSEEQKRFN